MKYFSMFSGIGGFELGIQQSHPDWECVGYSEIDKYAVQVYSNHFNHKNYGDATTISTSDLPDFDLLVGGFPCQAFSIAGKRRGFDEARGTLFFEIARILRDKRPRYFVLENVKGLLSHDSGKTLQTIFGVLTDLGYDVEWQVLNSKNHGVPQNRERIFFIGHIRGTSRPEILPIGNKPGEDTRRVGQEISYCLDSNYAKGTNTAMKSRRQVIPVLTPDRMEKRQNGRRFKDDGEPAFTLTAQDRHGVAILQLPHGANKGGIVHGVPAMTQSQWSYNNLLLRNYKIRRLTPTECERLQGFPDNWTISLSDTQRYKTLGNAVTVNVIKEIFDRF